MKNLLIVGSAGYLAQAYIQDNKENYRFFGIDKVSGDSSTSLFYKEYVADITDMKNVNQIKIEFEKEAVKLDAILFSVGINTLQSFYSIDEATWDETFSVNLKSIVFIMKGLYPIFNDSISIVLVGSQNGMVGHDHRIDYGPSKAGLIQLAKNLTIDFEEDKQKDIKVNVISPSYIVNPSNEKLLMDSFEGKKLLKKIPLKKFVQLEDVVGTIDFLFSDKSKAIRGQNIIVDYGYTIV